MNRVEAIVDRLDPRVSVRLRLLKKRLQGDVLLALARRLTCPGDVVLDIGANRGTYTHALSRLVGPTGRVHAFDPMPINVRSLEVLGRAHGNVVVHPVALSDEDGSGTLHIPTGGRRGQLDALARLGPPPPRHHDTLTVRRATLDGILGDGPPPTFVKCDVEGHEHEVLEGGRAVLAEHLPALVVEIEQRHRDLEVGTTVDELLGWGYDGYALSERALTPIGAFDVERDQLRHLDGWVEGRPAPAGYLGNFLFVRPGTDLGPLAATWGRGEGGVTAP